MLAILARVPVGSAPTIGSIAESLRWSWPRRGGRLRDDLVAWSHEEAELLGLTGRGALSSFGRILCAVPTDAESSRSATRPFGARQPPHSRRCSPSPSTTCCSKQT